MKNYKKLSEYERVSYSTKFELDIKKDVEITRGVFEKELILEDGLVVRLKAPTVSHILYVDELDVDQSSKEIYYRMMCIDHFADDNRTYSDFTFDEIKMFFENNNLH